MKNTPNEFYPSPYSPLFRETQVSLSNGIQIHAEVGGNPEHPCIVLIMGLGCQMIHWPIELCQQLIEQGFFIVRFDNRDIGLSSKTNTTPTHHNLLNMMIRFKLGLKNNALNYTLEDMAEDTALLMEALNIHQYHVIGASMGGMIAQILAAQYPNRVQKLVLLFTSNNQAFLPAPGIKQFKVFFSKAKSNQKNDVIRHNIKVNRALGSPELVNDNTVKNIAEIAYDRCYMPSSILQQLLAILCTGSLKKWDKKIMQPTLVIHGQCDKLLPAKHGKTVATAIKGAKFELISGMGHDIPSEYVPRLSTLFTHHFKS